MCKEFKTRGISLQGVQIFEAIPGYGVKTIVDQKEILVGTRKLMNRYNIDITNILPVMEELRSEWENSDACSIDGQYAGLVAVADTIKDTSKNSYQTIKRNEY